MPGKFAITLPPEAFRAFFDYTSSRISRRATISRRPSQSHRFRATAQRRPRAPFHLVRWGFLPGFVKDPKDFLADHQRARRDADERRASAPPSNAAAASSSPRNITNGATGQDARGRRPFLIRRDNGEPMGFAGLYETYRTRTAARSTPPASSRRAANSADGDVHDRMPACSTPEISRLARLRRRRGWRTHRDAAARRQ